MRRNRPLLKEVCHFEAINIRLKVMFTANIYTPLDRGMVLIQLCAGSFHTKTVSKNACSPRKFSRSLKSENNDKDKDLQISPRGSSRTRTFLEDNNTGCTYVRCSTK